MKKKYFSWFLLAGFIGFFFWYLLENLDDFKVLLKLNPALLLVIAAGHIGTVAANGWFVRIILRPFGKLIASRESFFISLLSTIGNYFTPFRGGAGVRAIYLKKKHSLSYSDFLSTLSGNYIIVFLLNSLAGLIALLVLRERASVSAFLTVLITLLAVFGGSLLVATFGLPSKVFRRFKDHAVVGRLTGILNAIVTSWNKIVANRWLVWQLLGITLFNFGLMIIMTKAAASALGFAISWWGVILYSSLGSLSLLLSITPGSIGIRESIFIFSSTAIGLSTEQILAMAVVDRGVLFAVLFVGWILTPWLKRSIGLTTDGSE